MSKELNDDFLQPLRKRPGLKADLKFKNNLENLLLETAHNKVKNRKLLSHFIPNILTAALLLLGVFIGFDLISKGGRGETGTPNPGKTKEQTIGFIDKQPGMVKLTEKLAKEIVGQAYAHMLVVFNSGGPETGKTFNLNGQEYRFMGEDFDTKEEILQYLLEKYTKDRATQLYDEHPFIEYQGKIAQINKQYSGDFLWQDTEAAVIQKRDDTKAIIEYKVPIETEGDPKLEVFDINLKYEDGWKIDGILPLSSEGNGDITFSKTSEEFRLTDEEMEVYKVFSHDLDETHLKGLSPISIAKLYVRSEWESRYDITYALYTDRDGYIQWTKEYDQEIPTSDRGTKEQTFQIFSGIEKGNFIQTSEFEGHIEFTNGNGFQGFKMVKDEDGIWNVSFTPIQ